MYVLDSAWAAILLYHLGILCFLICSPDRKGRVLPERGGSRWIWFAAPVAASGGLVLAVGWPWFTEDPGALPNVLAGLGLSGASWWVFALYYVVANPWLEEAFWRGWLAPTDRGLHWHDAAFAIYHGFVLAFFVDAVWIVVAVAVLIGAAWAWRSMVRLGGGLAGPVATHLAADIGIVLAAGWLLRG